MRSLLLVMALCLFAATAPAATPVGSLKVFVKAAEVQERRDVDDVTKMMALKAKKDAAKEARKVLEKELKDKHGKKEEHWPTEVQDQLFEAREVEAFARADYEYVKIDPKGLKDSAQDVVESLQKKGSAGVKELAQVVGSPEEADLVVEIMARRGEATKFTLMLPLVDTCYLLFTLGAGGEMPKERFTKVPANYRYRGSKHPKGSKYQKHLTWKVRSPKPDEPWFYFESRNDTDEFGCYSTAADGASAVINKFIEDNYALLKGL